MIIARSIPPAPLNKGGADRRGDLTVFNTYLLSKMKGYKDKYKVRVGDYRIGLTIDRTNRTIICQRVAHRREIYKIFP